MNEEKISYPEYYRGYNKVIKLINANKIDEAIIKFDSLSIGVPHVPSNNLFKIARTCAENGKCDLAAKYLSKSLINGHEYGKAIGSNKVIEPCKIEIDQVLDNERETHREHFDFEYKALIDSMLGADQAARNELDYEKMRTVDSVNLETLLYNIKKNGYPGEKLIGHESAWHAFILILHMDQDKSNMKFKPILDKAYNNGELWPRGYAWIVDRRKSWGEGNLEPYYYHMPSEKFDEFNRAEIDEINRRRDSIGLILK